METKKQAHCVFRCQYHIVWIPRYRYNILTKGVAKYLQIKMDEVKKHYPEIEYIECNLHPDHIHLVTSFPPKYSVATVVQIIKSNTGKALKDKFDFLRQKYYGRGGIWSVGYFVSTVGLNEKAIRNYVKHQEKEDLGQAKLAI
jgi:putative transposase